MVIEMYDDETLNSNFFRAKSHLKIVVHVLFQVHVFLKDLEQGRPEFYDFRTVKQPALFIRIDPRNISERLID